MTSEVPPRPEARPEARPDDRDLLCHCLNVDRRTARIAIAAGARTVEDLQRVTGACTGCHTCYVDCQQLLRSCLKTSSEPGVVRPGQAPRSQE